MTSISSASGTNRKTQKGFLPDPAGLFGLAIFWSLFLFSGKKSLLCADTLWHIKVGQIILDTGHILTHDIFSHTVPDKPWTAHEWLAEIFMAFCYNIGGFPGVSLVFFLLASFTIYLLFRVSQKESGEWAAFLAITVAAAVAQTHLLIRPHIFTWFFGAVFLTLLINQSRGVWCLPILTALWGNLHGGVLLGLVLQGAFIAGVLLDNVSETPLKEWRSHWNRIRRLCLIFLLSTIAIGCNPFGYSLLLFPFQVSAEVFSKYISEWKAPNLQELWYARVWIIMLGALLVSSTRKISWTWRLLLVFLIYQALGHTRHLSIAALFLAPWTAMAIHSTLNKIRTRDVKAKKNVPLSPTSGPLLIVASFVILFITSAIQPGWWTKFTKDRFSLSADYSYEALNFLEKRGFPGTHLLNEYNWGGFLIFSLNPPPKVFIDGRADMYGEEVFGDYAKLHYVNKDTEEILKKYSIDWILFPKDSLLVRHMRVQPGWHEVFVDNHIAILALQK